MKHPYHSRLARYTRDRSLFVSSILTMYIIILFKSLYAAVRSIYAADIYRKLFVSTVISFTHAFTSHFGLALLYRRGKRVQTQSVKLIVRSRLTATGTLYTCIQQAGFFYSALHTVYCYFWAHAFARYVTVIRYSV